MDDSDAVRAWRDLFKLNISASWKHDIDITITDIELWREILKGWGYWKGRKWVKKAPFIKDLLSEYERRQFDEVREQDNLPERGGERVAERSYSPMPPLRCSSSGWKG